MSRIASCRCGGLSAVCEGEPVRISVCHCLDCQRRSGSAFAHQARFPVERVTITGESRTFTAQGGEGRSATFRFCPTCAGTIAYVNHGMEGMDGLVAIPVGAFADPSFPAPFYSVWESRKHPWLTIEADGLEHL